MPSTIHRIGNHASTNALERHNTETSHTQTGGDREIFLISDLLHVVHRVWFLVKLTNLIRSNLRVGIVIDTAVFVQHSVMFHRLLEAALKSSRSFPYSIAYKTLDIKTGSLSVTNVHITEDKKIIYTSSIAGPIDAFPAELFKALPCITVLKFNAPVQQSFYSDPHYHYKTFKDVSLHLFSNTEACCTIHCLWVSPKVLISSPPSQISLLDVLDIWKGEVPIRTIRFTGNFDRTLFAILQGRSLRNYILRVLPSLEKLDERRL